MVHSRDSMLDVTKWRPVTAVEPHHSCCGWRKTGILDSLTSSLAEPSFQAEDRHSYGDALPSVHSAIQNQATLQGLSDVKQAC